MRQVFDNTRPTRICPWHFLTIIQRKAKQQNTKKKPANKAVCNQLAAASIRFIRASKKAKKKEKNK